MNKARILIVDDQPEIRSAMAEILADEGYTVALAADAPSARKEVAETMPDLVLLDVWMQGEDGISLLKSWVSSGKVVPPVVMMSGHGTVDTAVEATRLGALDFIEKPVSLGKLLYMVESALKVRPKPSATLGAVHFLDLLANEDPWRQVIYELDTAVGRPEPLLMIGEPSTGRYTLAKRLSHLEGRPVTRISLAQESPASIGPAVKSVAGGAMVFLTDVDQSLPETQEALMRQFAGETIGRRRFVAASLPAIEANQRDNHVLQQLYMWLGARIIYVPPVRSYRDRLPDLVRYLVDQLVSQQNLTFRRIGVASLNRLRQHDWPGNLGEMQHVLKKLLSESRGSEVALSEVDAALSPVTPVSQPSEDLLSLPFREARERFERNYLQAQLELSGGRVSQLAARVGLERTHLYRKLKALGIDLPNEERE